MQPQVLHGYEKSIIQQGAELGSQLRGVPGGLEGSLGASDLNKSMS